MNHCWAFIINLPNMTAILSLNVWNELFSFTAAQTDLPTTAASSRLTFCFLCCLFWSRSFSASHSLQTQCKRGDLPWFERLDGKRLTLRQNYAEFLPFCIIPKEHPTRKLHILWIQIRDRGQPHNQHKQ